MITVSCGYTRLVHSLRIKSSSMVVPTPCPSYLLYQCDK